VLEIPSELRELARIEGWIALPLRDSLRELGERPARIDRA
jgi:hypothetical protein